MRLHRSDAEIFLGCEDERSCRGKQLIALVIGEAARKAHIGARERGNSSHLRAFAHDDELAVGQGCESLHDQIDPLVGNESRNGEIERRAWQAGFLVRVTGDVHGRVDHFRGATIATLDAFRNVLGDRHKAVDAGRGLKIPDSKPLQG